MTAYHLAVPTFTHMLGSLKGQLDKAAAFAAARGMQEAELIEARLAPDMFPLSHQVRFACFQVVLAVKELTGAEVPAFADDETTFEALKARIDATYDILAAAPKEAFDGVDDKAVALALPNGMIFDFTGLEFVRDWAIPQFYFHIVTAYAILRHKGIELGKPDYVPYVLPYIRPGTFPTA